MIVFYLSVAFLIAFVFTMVILLDEIKSHRQAGYTYPIMDALCVLLSCSCLGVFWPLLFTVPLAYLLGNKK